MMQKEAVLGVLKSSPEAILHSLNLVANNAQ